MNIYFDEDVRPDEQTASVMEAAAVAAFRGEGIDPETASISVCFVDSNEIHKLNLQYRGVDRPTDVLSFPAYAPGDVPAGLSEDSELAGESELSYGDVVICEDICAKQAEELGHSTEREIIYLFVHSVFHLLGYDHEEEEDKQDMRAREKEVMALLGIEE